MKNRLKIGFLMIAVFAAMVVGCSQPNGASGQGDQWTLVTSDQQIYDAMVGKNWKSMPFQESDSSIENWKIEIDKEGNINGLTERCFKSEEGYLSSKQYNLSNPDVVLFDDENRILVTKDKMTLSFVISQRFDLFQTKYINQSKNKIKLVYTYGQKTYVTIFEQY